MVINTEQFIKQIDEYKQVSMTASRALVLLLYMLDGPKSFEEIKEFLLACGVVSKEYSIDTIRIDLNSLKSIGCEITKATKTNDHKYELISFPFSLQLSSADVQNIKAIYKKLLKSISPGKILKYHYLFKKMAGLVADEQIKEELLGISILKSDNIKLIRDLVSSETKNNVVRILYMPPTHKECVEYDITLETIGVRSGRLYIFCYNHTLKSRSFLNISRIKSVASTMFDRNSCWGLDVRVRFKLRNFKHFELEENETVVEDHNDYAIVAGYYFNNFIAVQRMLYFADDCTVLEPDEIIEDIVGRLKEMRSIYD